MNDLRAQIAAAEALRTQRQAEYHQSEGAIELACERQRLRRQLDAINDEIAGIEDGTQNNLGYAAHIDQDVCGPHMDGARSGHRLLTAKAGTAEDESIRSHATCSSAVVEGELEWTIEGFSWLKTALKQTQEEEDTGIYSEPLQLAGNEFRLVYSPGHFTHYRMQSNPYGNAGPLKKFMSSLGLEQDTMGPLALRHSFFIRRHDGEFVQWGDTQEECHRQSCAGWVFGPDVKMYSSPHPEMTAAGIFGLSHEELLRSEWVSNDTLTVRVRIQVRRTKDIESSKRTAPPAIVVPPATLGCDLLAQLENAEESGDVSFDVEGEHIKAHAFILSARSDVFRQMLHGHMREATTREVEVHECDALTFRALLHFLYTDDLDEMDKWAAEHAGEERAAEASGATPASASASSSMRDGAVHMSEDARLISLLRRVLSVSHRYQLARLQRWSEKRRGEKRWREKRRSETR
jgi:hypothetical protein